MDKPISESPVELRSPDGALIPGIEVRPTGAIAAHVILLHGITTSKNEFANFFGRVAHRLAANGIASLRIDFRGHGDSRESWRNFTVASQILDTLAAIEWWRTKGGADSVHLLACSFGSPPALYSAQLRPSIVRTLSLICPVLDYRATFLEPRTDWAADLFNTESLQRAFVDGFLRMNENFNIDPKLIVEMEILKPYEVMKRISTPMLLVHGDADSMVPCDISRRYAADLSHVRLLTIPRMDHGFTDEDDETGFSAASERNLDRIVGEIQAHIGEQREAS